MTQCIVYPIKLFPMPEPFTDTLKIGHVGRHLLVVGNHYEEGTLGIFIPHGALVPDKLAEEMWVKGRLAGAKKNRVKGRVVAGHTSSGLFYGSRYFEIRDGQKVWIDSPSWNLAWKEGDDVTEEIGVSFKEA